MRRQYLSIVTVFFVEQLRRVNAREALYEAQLPILGTEFGIVVVLPVNCKILKC